MLSISITFLYVTIHIVFELCSGKTLNLKPNPGMNNLLQKYNLRFQLVCKEFLMSFEIWYWMISSVNVINWYLFENKKQKIVGRYIFSRTKHAWNYLRLFTNQIAYVWPIFKAHFCPQALALLLKKIRNRMECPIFLVTSKDISENYVKS